MQLNNDLKFWLFIALSSTIVLQLTALIIFNTSISLNLFNKNNIFLNLGSFLGVSGLMFAIAKPKNINYKILLILILLGFVFFIYNYNFNQYLVFFSPVNNLMSILSFVGLFIFLFNLKELLLNKNKNDYCLYFYLTLLFLLMALSTSSALAITKVIYPFTFDQVIYKIDSAFFNINIPIVNFYEKSHPTIITIVMEAYSLLSFLLFMVVALFIRESKHDKYHIVRVLVVPFGLAFICYSIIPLTGPIYAFGTQYFPLNMPNSNELLPNKIFVTPAARNAMPSMHLTGALLIFLLTAALNKKIYFYASILFLFLTAYATLALGEHYVLDLVVALPFSVVFQKVC